MIIITELHFATSFSCPARGSEILAFLKLYEKPGSRGKSNVSVGILVLIVDCILARINRLFVRRISSYTDVASPKSLHSTLLASSKTSSRLAREKTDHTRNLSQLGLPNPPNLRLTGHALIMLTPRILKRITNLPAPDIRLWLLIDDQLLGLADRIQSLFLDPSDQVFAGRDVMDETDDLTGGPDLSNH